MSRLAVVLVSGVLMLGLAACSSDVPKTDEVTTEEAAATSTQNPEPDKGGAEAAGSDAVQAEPQNLELTDSNYVVSNGYVYFAVEISNPNDGFAADFATITVTSKHEDGTIGFSDEWVVGNLLPGSNTYWASQAGDGETVETDNVEISISVNKNNWSKSDQTLPSNLYSFESTTVASDKYGRLEAKGEITLNEDFSFGMHSSDTPMIVCILKDQNGKIVTGFNGFLNSELTVGAPTVFDIDAYFDEVEYASFEMYGNMW